MLWISASNAPPYSTPDKTGFEDRLFTEIFRRLGIEVRIYDVPSERGLSLLNEGRDDGTLARNAGMAQRYPNLVQFSEKALDREYLAYTKRADIEVTDWNSLAGFDVGIVNGWKILEENITTAGSLIKVRDGAQLFRILDEGRIDLAVFNRWGGLYLLRELGLKGVRALEPPLARRKVFFYMNKRHAALAEQASEVLRQMKLDGSYQRLIDETLGPLTS
ncbi:MAG: transporter substrate-binding domain-containing protein [Kiloniellaceae bacterium]